VLTVQPYSPEYREQIVNLILTIQQNEFGIPITITDQPDLLSISQSYQTNNGNFWMALDQTRVVGTIALIDIGNNQAALRKMFLHQAYRGKPIGVAQHLLDTLLNWARDKEITDIYLGTTEWFKAAHRFYEKNGFIPIEKAELPPAFPCMEVDTRFYKYTLCNAES
jgi:N-acetylglutamate synthase-like GNAT family acetyltransferase